METRAFRFLRHPPEPRQASRMGGIPLRSNEISDSFGFLPSVLDLTCLAQQVSIDVEPREEANQVNLRRHTKVTVAVVGSPEHDPASLDPAGVRFGATGREASSAQAAMKDADRDGDVDLVLRFRIQELGVMCGDTFAVLTGLTDLGGSVFGSDAVETAGCT